MTGKEIVFEVTREDIRNGRRFDGAHCPFARALSRETGGPVNVGEGGIWISGRLRPVAVPARLKWQVRAYDFLGWMRPGVRRMRVPGR